jgi:aldehyde dehydrogenase (NAD+)
VRKLRAGSVFVNAGGLDMNSPFGGYKQSGNGREFGKFGIEEFMEVKSVIGELPADVAA